MRLGFTGRCERVRQNNGIVEVLVIRRAAFGDQNSQDEISHWNINAGREVVFYEGKSYYVEIRLIDPELVKEKSS